ncbi:MAG TPA: DUF2877 domain-containing protein [Anaerolineae bacterium]|nr:DUF2877 domain-containing protein [Anaerolineae bacterium]
MFLLIPPQRMIFASVENYHSPLTINLDRSCDRLRNIEVGAVAQISDTRLIFPSIEFSVLLSEERVWRCPAPNLSPRPHTAQMQTLHAIAAGVMARRGHGGWADLLLALLDWSTISSLSAEQAALRDRLSAVRHAVQAGNSSALQIGLTGLLGQGRGLTPSGDDVVIGLLLMLARSPRVNSQADDENMLKHVIAAAYQGTTTISANLIECAASGQGDERLITVVDGIIAGSASLDECVECVLGWGSSSGIDALIGMAMAVQGYEERREE